MATIHIHPTATTRRHIEAIQARTGLIAVLGGAGSARLVPNPRRVTTLIRRATQRPTHADHDWPPGAA
ncbi:MAG: hypothetical protein CL549_15855 [Alcanivorax sp.]|nr:hypothetical protein [Alcanivorax sp.]MAY11933.1 hypothetical protein [Alcanivorax sp.]MBI56751.1 hypothetical protein [Alcanivorax sp.]MBM1145616.1 hypothetical protein [Alcanivorax sp. ZXX171]HCE39701.1 hypothetical protein [Alcanivorax sp.]|tara:strand:+ start:34702 stop:34905 length:204 start_codon:yes stop_codon:yes gene_type:complete